LSPDSHGSSRALDYHDKKRRASGPILDDTLHDKLDLTCVKLNDPERYIRTYKRARAKMGKAAGTDRVRGDDYSDSEIAQALRRISKSVSKGTFVASEHREVLLPKPDGRFRTLSIPILAERVIAKSLNNALLDVLDSQMPDAFHGYRRNRGILTLLATIAASDRTGKNLFVATADIQDAFPSTSKASVAAALQEFVPDEALRDLLLRLSFPGTSEKGLPQGLATSTTLFILTLSHRLTWGPSGPADDTLIRLAYSDNLVYVSSTAEAIRTANLKHQDELSDIGMNLKAPDSLNPILVSSEASIDILGTTLTRRNGALAYRPMVGGWQKLERDIRNTYCLADPITGAANMLFGWIERNRHIVASFGVTSITSRLVQLCTTAGIEGVSQDSVENAAVRAEREWKLLVEGHNIPLPPEPTTDW